MNRDGAGRRSPSCLTFGKGAAVPAASAPRAFFPFLQIAMTSELDREEFE
jgi:hypothetical protein